MWGRSGLNGEKARPHVCDLAWAKQKKRVIPAKNTPGDRRRRRLAAGRSPPEVLKTIPRPLGVAHRVLGILLPQPCPQRPRVLATVCYPVAAALPPHSSVD